MKMPAYLRLAGFISTAAAAVLLGTPGATWAQQPRTPITWTAVSPASSVAAGATLKAELTVKIDEGWHLYSLTQNPPPDPTRIVVADGQPFTLGGKIEAPAPETGFDQAQGSDTEFYTDRVAFKVPLTVAKGTAPGKHVAKIKATWQACSGTLCLRPQTSTLDVTVQVTASK